MVCVHSGPYLNTLFWAEPKISCRLCYLCCSIHSHLPAHTSPVSVDCTHFYDVNWDQDRAVAKTSSEIGFKLVKRKAQIRFDGMVGGGGRGWGSGGGIKFIEVELFD